MRVRDADILDVLQEALTQEVLHRPGTADGDVNTLAIKVPMPIGVINRAIDEIEWYRRMYGAVTRGEPFSDLREKTRRG